MSLNGIKLGGLAIAVFAYTVTQTLVTALVGVEPAGLFLPVAVAPVAAGLSLTAVGVALAVGAFPERYVDTVAKYVYVGGVGALAALAVASLVGRTGLGDAGLASTLALVGALGGAVLGDRVAANARRSRLLGTQLRFGELVNEQLRHEVLNAATVIDGMAELASDDDPEAVDAINDAVERLEMTVNSITDVTDDAEPGRRRVADVGTLVREEVAALGGQAPATETAVGDLPSGTHVLADGRLRLAVRKAVEWVGEHAPSGPVRVDASVDDGVEIAVDGPSSGEREAAATPSARFLLRVVELVVERHGGVVETVGDGRDRRPPLRIRLPETAPGDGIATVDGVARARVRSAAVAGVVGGVLMGLLLQATGSVAVIGALYGVESAVVGWVTHLFHSVTFALLLAAGLSATRLDDVASGRLRTAAVGAAFGALLWLVAAGLLMPAWARLLGVAVPFPNLPVTGLLTHLVWGVAVGVTYRTACAGGPRLRPDSLAGLFRRSADSGPE